MMTATYTRWWWEHKTDDEANTRCWGQPILDDDVAKVLLNDEANLYYMTRPSCNVCWGQLMLDDKANLYTKMRATFTWWWGQLIPDDEGNLYINICNAYSQGHWRLRVIMKPTLSSLVAVEVVIMTTSSATNDAKVGIMTTQSFLWLSPQPSRSSLTTKLALWQLHVFIDYNDDNFLWQQSWHYNNSEFSFTNMKHFLIYHVCSPVRSNQRSWVAGAGLTGVWMESAL